MKKKNLKSLNISKVLISNFNINEVKGGASGLPYTCHGRSCYVVCAPIEDPR